MVGFAKPHRLAIEYLRELDIRSAGGSYLDEIAYLFEELLGRVWERTSVHAVSIASARASSRSRMTSSGSRRSIHGDSALRSLDRSSARPPLNDSGVPDAIAQQLRSTLRHARAHHGF